MSVPRRERPHPSLVPESGPLTFDIGKWLTGEDDVVAILTTRKALDELGVGGLTGPVIAYRPTGK
jgi:hypothetical protein